MIRWVEKKNWRKNIEACWNVSDKVNKCLDTSKSFESLDSDLKLIIRKSVHKNYIIKYVNSWVSNTEVTGDERNFYNSSSDLREINRDNLEALNTECDIFSLQQCCNEKYNLSNLEGDYDYFAQSMKKK
jgi:hypothetical protein